MPTPKNNLIAGENFEELSLLGYEAGDLARRYWSISLLSSVMRTLEAFRYPNRNQCAE
jgi:hypothetical protein